MKNNKREEELYHNTTILLKKYRQVRWALELSAQKATEEFCSETGIAEQFLNAVTCAGADISYTHLEGRARSLERSRRMLTLINDAVDFLKLHHPKGAVYSRILYLCFFSPTEETQEAILQQLEKEGIVLSMNTMRKYRNEAVKVIGEILWGYDVQDSAGIMADIEKVTESVS